MIPDKIYVGVGTLSSILPAEEYAFPGWQEKPYLQVRNVEYIRKDALLEWLEQNRNQSQMWFDRYYDREDLSAKQVWEEVIDKLNSL